MVIKSAPKFDGKLSVTYEVSGMGDEYIIARWEKDSFYDHGDVNDLSYSVALG